MTDIYNTIKSSSEGFYKEKGSKFFGYAYPVSNEEDIKNHIEALKKEHHSARHWCYAWRLKPDGSQTRANDDGEPSNSAGAPMLGQILSFEVTNCLVVVVRYFGGTKLGVGGLITAYKAGAQQALSNAEIVEKFVLSTFQLIYDYDKTTDVNRFIASNNAEIISQEFNENCTTTVGVRLSEADIFFEQAKQFFGITVKKL